MTRAALSPILRSTSLRLAALVVLASGLTTGISRANAGDAAAAQKPALLQHADQGDFVTLVVAGERAEAFEAAFEEGNELFDTSFNALDGVGANVGGGQRFTRTPRADLHAPGEWATHTPKRATGPNAQSCTECHAKPEDGAGPASANVSRDPEHTANPGKFINRNTPHLFGMGALQRLAEEMNVELEIIRSAAIAEAKAGQVNVKKSLISKGVKFGRITAHGNGSVSTSEIQGVDPNLVVKPFQWKGTVAFVRDFARDAGHNELGMQAVEFAGEDQDGDFDGVVNELTVGDLTAMAIYNAAQPRPTTRSELAQFGLIPALPAEELTAIAAGSGVFDQAGCVTCHLRSMTIQDPVFSEPSQNPNYRDVAFPTGQDPASRGVDPSTPITFDLTTDQPDNQIYDETGQLAYHLGAFEQDPQGGAVVRLLGDLKRHEMGERLAESIDEKGTGASVFMTENLWGVGSTAPYLHDGRATTLSEAILEHGGEAAASRAKFVALSEKQRQDLITFLDNQILYKIENLAKPD